MLNLKKTSLLPLILTVVIVVFDRLTKLLVTNTMRLGQSDPFLGDVVRWTHVHNYGMAFGMDLTGGAVLGWISVVAVVVILSVMLRTPDEASGTRWVLAAILGGALGNTYDRLVFGYVVDFIDVDLPAFISGMDRWPVFNVADSAVSVGVVLLIVMMFLPQKGKAGGDVQAADDRGLNGSDGNAGTMTMTAALDSGTAGSGEVPTLDAGIDDTVEADLDQNDESVVPRREHS